MGSDFTNGDLTRLDLFRDYDCSFIEGGKDNNQLLILNAKDKTISYDKVNVSTNLKTFIPNYYQFYSLSGKLMKTLNFENTKLYHGYFKRPSKLVMNNELIKNKKTTLVYDVFDLKKKIPDYLFQTENLSEI
jgi:hypothetical protein